MLPMSSCNVGKQACVATLPDGGQLEFSIEPRPIPSLKPLQLQATIRGSKVRRIEVDLVGADMKMGFNRPVLEERNGRYSGLASLPVCVTGKMAWQATVLVETGKQLVAIPFRFEVASE